MNNVWTIAPTEQDQIFALLKNGQTVVLFGIEHLEDFVELIATHQTAKNMFPGSFKTPSSDPKTTH